MEQGQGQRTAVGCVCGQTRNDLVAVQIVEALQEGVAKILRGELPEHFQLTGTFQKGHDIQDGVRTQGSDGIVPESPQQIPA